MADVGGDDRPQRQPLEQVAARLIAELPRASQKMLGRQPVDDTRLGPISRRGGRLTFDWPLDGLVAQPRAPLLAPGRPASGWGAVCRACQREYYRIATHFG